MYGSENTPDSMYPQNTIIPPAAKADVPKPVHTQPSAMMKKAHTNPPAKPTGSKVPNSNPNTATKPSMGNMGSGNMKTPKMSSSKSGMGGKC